MLKSEKWNFSKIEDQLSRLKTRGVYIVEPVSKNL